MICADCGKDIVAYTALGITTPAEHDCPSKRHPWRVRAENAEARVAELEAGLRDIRVLHGDLSWRYRDEATQEIANRLLRSADSVSDPLCGDPGPLPGTNACQRPKGHDGDHQSSEAEMLSSWPRTAEAAPDDESEPEPPFPMAQPCCRCPHVMGDHDLTVGACAYCDCAGYCIREARPNEAMAIVFGPLGWHVWGSGEKWWVSGPYRKTREEAEADLRRCTDNPLPEVRVQLHNDAGEHLCWEGTFDEFKALNPFRCEECEYVFHTEDALSTASIYQRQVNR